MPVYTIILSLGRTGTKWLARTLAHDPRISSKHETPGDGPACLEAIRVRGAAQKRSYGLAKRLIRAGQGKTAAIEVNGLLRYHAPFIKQHIPELQLIYLARDGRKTVNSMRNKNLGGTSIQIINTVGRGGKDSFHRICLYWVRTSRMLRAICDETWRFEDLLADYAIFSTAISKLGAKIDEPTWETLRKKKINAGRRPARSWTLAEQRLFNSLAKTEQIALGYKS